VSNDYYNGVRKETIQREFYLIFGAKFENEMYTRFCEENKWD